MVPRSSWIALLGPEVEENLGLRYIAASLEQNGFCASIIPFNGQGDVLPVLEQVLAASPAPSLLAISLSFQWRARDVLALCIALRERGYSGHITSGGHFGTLAAEELLGDFPELDSICLFEAEETVADLARALSDGTPLAQVPGLALRSLDGPPQVTPPRPPPDLSCLPWPDRQGEPSSCLGHRIAPLVSSRGCYASCSFCCIATWHRRAPGGKRFRSRSPEAVAEEMAWLYHHRDIHIFIFHDDNFFLPHQSDNLARIDRLVVALQARGVGRIATVVKARPNDVSPQIFQAMKERLGCMRVFLGIESNADQGLRTLGRGVSSSRNHEALEILFHLGLYINFNLLIFDPDTTLESLELNLLFMERYAEVPFNFGRVELYAGTPLLARMLAEGRCQGSYLGWDYKMTSPEVQLVFTMAMRCFHQRNFAAGALANRLMGTRFDVEVCRHFTPQIFQPRWIEEVKGLSRTLARSSVQGLRGILEVVRSSLTAQQLEDALEGLHHELRQTEQLLLKQTTSLEEEIQTMVGIRCHHSRLLPYHRGVFDEE